MVFFFLSLPLLLPMMKEYILESRRGEVRRGEAWQGLLITWKSIDLRGPTRVPLPPKKGKKKK